MGYTPVYPNALFAKPLLNQLIAVIQRDQAAAIALVSPSLQPIAEFHKGPGVRAAFPWLSLAIDGVAFGENEFPYTRSQTARVQLLLDVGQFDQEIAQDNAQDYARVLDMVVTSASSADWVASLPIVQETVPSGMTTPGAAGSIKLVFVQSHRYSLVSAQEIRVPVLRVTLSLLFELEET